MLRRLARRVPRWGLLLVGLYLLEHTALEAFGGREKLWFFQKWDHHRFTSMAMLTGTLRLRGGLAKVGPDEQVFDGASYDNWGFGVPLLQAPFHLFAKLRHWSGSFFPERAIYFFYLALLVPILWAAFDRLLSMRARPGSSRLRGHALSWAATGAVLSFALFPLMSCRFLIYEESIAYFVIAELLALSAYVFALRSWSRAAVLSLGLAAGVGLIIRPTGLMYLGAWSLLLLVERRTWRDIGTFAAGAAPAVVFWLVSNRIKSGSVFGLGFMNSLPWMDMQTPMVRFGCLCSDGPRHTMQVAIYLLRIFFVGTPSRAGAWLDKCHLVYEERPTPADLEHAPVFGMAVLAALVWMLLHQVVARERRLWAYVPYAGLAVVFGSYVWAGAGFAWRYAGDFWPLMVLAAVQYVRFLPERVTHHLGVRLAMLVWMVTYANDARAIEPSLPSVEMVDPERVQGQWDDFIARRDATDPPLASKIACGQVPSWPFHNGQGWSSSCSVDTFTNVFLGVPAKNGDRYQVRFKTQGFDAEELRVYVNGRIYRARREGDVYAADVDIPQDRLRSRIVMATVEWVRGLDPPAGKLLSIELV